MKIKALTAFQHINPVFRGGDFIHIFHKNPVIAMAKYNTIIMKLERNIKNIPINIIRELAVIHNDETIKAIKLATFHPDSDAQRILLSHIESNDNITRSINIIAIGDIDIFFEYGVREHKIFPSMDTIRGAPVAAWLEERGLSSTIVGGPGSSLQKPGIRFMEKGFNKSALNSVNVTDQIIKTI